MAELPFRVTIFFLMISGCICPRGRIMDLPPEDERKLFDIFYKIDPSDKHIYERVKEAWDRKLPLYNYIPKERLENYIKEARRSYWSNWLKHPGPEREELEKTLVDIYGKTKGKRSGHEKRMLKMLLQCRPQYIEEYEMYRNIVYRWYEKLAPLGKEINPGDVDWTPQRLANLLHITKQFKGQGGHTYTTIKNHWLTMYNHLNVNERNLVNFAYYLERDCKHKPAENEKLIAEQKYQELFHSETELEREKAEKQVYWTHRMKAYLSYIYHQLPYTDIDLAAAVKDRWDRMRPEHTLLGKDFLLAQAKDLESARYKPKPEHIKEAMDMYENLPPIPRGILFGRAGEKVSRQLRIPGKQTHNRSHQDEPASPSIDFPPELLAHLDEDMAYINAPYAGHDYYSHQTGYHGSSSHTPVEHVPSVPLQDIRHQEHHHSYTGGSRSPTPIHDDIFRSLPDIHYEHPEFGNVGGSSSHTSIEPDPHGSLTLTPYPQHHFWDASGSNEYTSIYHNQTGSYADTPRPGHRQRHQGGSSSHISIHENPSGLIVVTSHPEHHKQDPGGSSSHVPFHQNETGSYAGSSRPDRRHRHQSGSSSHTPIYQGQFSSLPDSSRPHQHFSHPSGSSSYIYNQPYTSVPLEDIPYQHHFPWNPSSSSDYTPIYHNQTGSYADTPRPPRRLRHQSSGSRHARHSPQE